MRYKKYITKSLVISKMFSIFVLLIITKNFYHGKNL